MLVSSCLLDKVCLQYSIYFNGWLGSGKGDHGVGGGGQEDVGKRGGG